jgi:hypothetical protein
MIELSANGGLFEELAHLRAEARGELPRLHVIKPEYPLPLDPDFYLGRIDAPALIASGYRDAKRYLAAVPVDGVPYDQQATRMRDPIPGAAFADRLAGTISLDGTSGDATVEVRVDVRDLASFLAGPERVAELVGVVDAGPLGRGLLAKAGSFRLEGGRLRYELVVEHGGRDLCLVVEAPNRPWNGGAELSIHDGATADGARLGGGTLRSGLRSELHLLRSLQATGTDGVRSRVENVARFGRLLARGR